MSPQGRKPTGGRRAPLCRGWRGGAGKRVSVSMRDIGREEEERGIMLIFCQHYFPGADIIACAEFESEWTMWRLSMVVMSDVGEAGLAMWSGVR